MIRVVLADDHEILREGLKSLLEREPDIEVIAQAADGRAAVSLAQNKRPDVLVMDIGMPGLNGIDATRQVVESACGTRVLTLSMHSDHRFVVEALRAGATGYLVKGCAFEELVTAIRNVGAGRAYISPSIAGLLITDYVSCLNGVSSGAESAQPLSPREREVLQLIAEGISTKRIASMLGVSIKTIETHRRQIMLKLGIDSLAGLTKYAIREGITTLDS